MNTVDPLSLIPAPTAAIPAYTRFRQTRFFSNLDGLRAISIIAVIWHHSAREAVPETIPLLQQGNRGVGLFFVISAFLISTLLVRAREKGTLNVPRFWARRALRIFPLYFAVLAIYVAVVGLFERDPVAKAGFFSNLPYFATFTSNWFVSLEGRVIFYFAWSLAVEEQFYLCWPWMEKYLPRRWPTLLCTAMLVTSTAATVAHHETAQEGLVWVLAKLPPEIFMGAILAHLLHQHGTFQVLYRVVGTRASAGLATVVLLTALAVEPALGGFGPLVTGVSMTFLVAACVAREDSGLVRVLRWRPLAWIGVVSYGMYLTHMLCVNAAGRLGSMLFEVTSPWIDFIGGTLLTVAVATASFCTFERFFLRIKDRYLGESAAAVSSSPSPLPGDLPALDLLNPTAAAAAKV